MYDFKNKNQNITQLNNYMLAKTLSMFEYESLPNTIPYRELEKQLQVNGYSFITEVKGSLYALSGSLGGVPDVYGNPTTITVNNVALGFNETLSIADDGVLITNDDLMIGIVPLIEKHNTLLVENDINMVLNGYNSRMQTLISASDDRTKESAESYVNKLISGDVAVIGENALFDGVKIHTAHSSQGTSVSNMLEYHQYIKGTLNNELGISSAFNMKKERLITSEVNQSEDSLFPYVYNMMKCRLKAVELINTKYGTQIDVDFGSVWSKKSKEIVDDIVDDVTTESVDDIDDTIVTSDVDEPSEGEQPVTSESQNSVESDTDNVLPPLTNDSKYVIIDSNNPELNELYKDLENKDLSDSDRETIQQLIQEILENTEDA